MRETIYQKVDRLQRQKGEWETKCKEANRTIRELSTSLRKQTVDPSIIDGFKETIESQKTTIQNLQSELSELEEQNHKLNADIESLREFVKYLQREEKDPSVLELMKVEEEDGQNRLEYFNSGYWEDKWGQSFFDDLLLLTINPFNGVKLNFVSQADLVKLLKADYNDLWIEKQRQLERYRLQYDKYLMDELTFKKRKNQLGLDIWNEISKDWRIHIIFSDTTEKKLQELPF
ncbi:MAG: hypothetical protein J5732_04785 [Bacteroidaceae bacterium]|nr:hypothetical protein [Bacteroidaceae bacterium]